MTTRRGFLGCSLAVVGGIFVPQYGGWYRQGSGILVPVRIHLVITTGGKGDGSEGNPIFGNFEGMERIGRTVVGRWTIPPGASLIPSGHWKLIHQSATQSTLEAVP